MFGSSMLEVALGLFFTYWLLSVIVTYLVENASTLFSRRHKFMVEGLRELLGAWYHKVVENPVLHLHIKNSDQKKDGDARYLDKPGGLPAHYFARALVRSVTEHAQTPHTAWTVRRWLQEVDQVCGEGKMPRELQRTLHLLLDDTQGPLSLAYPVIEDWFVQFSEQRISQRYQNWNRVWFLLASVILVLGANVDSFVLSERLWTDDTLKAEVLLHAKQVVERERSQEAHQPGERGPAEALTDQMKHFQRLPLGWSQELEAHKGPLGWSWLLGKLAGLLTTILAVSLGAPFWAGTMERTLALRGHPNSPGAAPRYEAPQPQHPQAEAPSATPPPRRSEEEAPHEEEQVS